MKGFIYGSVLVLALMGHCQPALISVLRLREENPREEPTTNQPSRPKLERWMQVFYDRVWESQCGDNCDAEGPKVVTEEMIKDYITEIRYLQFRRLRLLGM